MGLNDIFMLFQIIYLNKQNFKKIKIERSLNDYLSGAKRTRTADPLHAMQVLYQLSYGPKSRNVIHINQSKDFFRNVCNSYSTLQRLINRFCTLKCTQRFTSCSMLSGTLLKQFRTYLKSQVGHGWSVEGRQSKRRYLTRVSFRSLSYKKSFINVLFHGRFGNKS